MAILSGEEPLSNLDIRVGDSDLSSSVSGGNQWMSGNERCGKFFGPTLVPQQWVEVDCGFIKGMLGRFVTLQLTERFGSQHPLEISELEIYGWGKACELDEYL